eukprot:6093413-Amphidinium_carterae.2
MTHRGETNREIRGMAGAATLGIQGISTHQITPGLAQVVNLTRGKDPKEMREQLLASRASASGHLGAEVRVKAQPGRTEPPSVALICFRCANELLHHHIPDGKSFVTQKGGPSRCFRNFAEATKPIASDRDRKMQRWTEWDTGVNKHMRQHVSSETLTRLSAEFAGGEDWVSMVGNGRVSILYTHAQHAFAHPCG